MTAALCRSSQRSPKAIENNSKNGGPVSKPETEIGFFHFASPSSDIFVPAAARNPGHHRGQRYASGDQWDYAAGPYSPYDLHAVATTWDNLDPVEPRLFDPILLPRPDWQATLAGTPGSVKLSLVFTRGRVFPQMRTPILRFGSISDSVQERCDIRLQLGQTTTSRCSNAAALAYGHLPIQNRPS